MSEPPQRPKRIALTLYRIRPEFRGAYKYLLRDDYQQMLEARDERLATYSLRRAGATGRLYVFTPQPKRPAWAEFLGPGFKRLDVPAGRSSSAVLILTLPHPDRGPQRFAYTFGAGRFMLDPFSYERKYGLQVALNAMYEDGSAGSRVRSVAVTTIEANTIRTRKDANHDTGFDDFEVDISRDLLDGITGKPVQPTWGSRVSGGDAFRSNAFTGFDDIIEVSRRIAAFESERHWEARFGWTKNVRLVTEAALRTRLMEALIDELRRMRSLSPEELAHERIGIGPGGTLDWRALQQFHLALRPSAKTTVPTPDLDLEIADYFRALGEQAPRARLTPKLLKSQTIYALRDPLADSPHDDPEAVLEAWPVLHCIDGELTFEGRTYVILEGQFYAVAPGYQAELDRFLDDDINLWATRLVRSKKGEHEGPYNERAAADNREFLCMDKHLIHVPDVVGNIEFCDILTSDGDFVHVKRGTRSSSLSHLFAQGSVAGELFLRSADFRAEARTRILGEATDQGRVGSRFATFDRSPVRASNYHVVYAMVDRWDGQRLREKLPFFSKVNLRRHHRDMRSMGLRVSAKKVGIGEA